MPFSAAPQFDAGAAGTFIITPTSGIAFEIQNPANPGQGQPIFIVIRNTTGGPLGVLTFGSEFRFAGGAGQPGAGTSRVWAFLRYLGTWNEIIRVLNVPNP